MRILKGQEILPDDSTLAEHGITDDDTVNIVIEPEKKITIKVLKAPGLLSHSVSHYEFPIANTVSIQEVKNMLTTQDDMVISDMEFDLEIINIKNRVFLDDTSFPLHYYGIDEDSELKIVKNVADCIIQNQKGEVMHLTLSVNTTVRELRNKLCGNDKCKESVVLFTKNGYVWGSKKSGLPSLSPLYKKLVDDEASICIWNNRYPYRLSFHVIENRYTKILSNISPSKNCLLYEDIVGIEEGDTVGSVKLRCQDQLDIPAHWIRLSVFYTAIGTCKISRDSQLFSSFATKWSHLSRNLRNFHFWGGTLPNFFEFFNFLDSFYSKLAQNDLQW